MLRISFQALLDRFGLSTSFITLPLLITGLFLLCWRLWRFTVVPYIKPSEPKELPYWIPYLGTKNPRPATLNRFVYLMLIHAGHVHSFFKDYNRALEQGRKYFNDTKEVYSVWIAGTRIYICTSPKDVASLYRNTTTISYHNVIKDMYRWIGVSDDGFKKMFTLNPSSRHNDGLPSPQAPAIMINDYHRLQTRPGAQLDDLLYNRLIPAIDQALAAVIDGSSNSVVDNSGHATTVSLLQLCTNMFVHGTTTAFLGTKIWEVNPNLLDSFKLWERTNWKYMFQMPDLISGDMLQARDEIIDSFVKYLDIPEEQRADRNEFLKSVEAMMRDVGCDQHDMARVLMLHFWAVLGNIYKVGFWTLAHLAYEPALLNTIRSEVKPAVKGGQLDERYLSENCVLLDSLISEVLRLTVASALVRDIVAPTQIGGKTLLPGSKVLVPYRQLHLNHSVWGPDPSVLVPDRFAEDPKLQSSKSYRPFGGGNTLCPGRFLAKRVLGYAVASILTKFETSVDVGKTREAIGGKGKCGTSLVHFPRIDHTKPSPGASLPVKGEDVFLIFKAKEAIQ